MLYVADGEQAMDSAAAMTPYVGMGLTLDVEIDPDRDAVIMPTEQELAKIRDVLGCEKFSTTIEVERAFRTLGVVASCAVETPSRTARNQNGYVR
ncbi:MAG: hypothetical protein EOP32_40100 [Rhodococcus sp. (in: high G+C Gram-positive bacteria)]|nr:MAG: hypothetical protein EOP32_40100 [Rhodococcus sp. (in: high G+C Gram-positive bacteria)]